MLFILSLFIVHIIKTEKKNKIRNCNFNPQTCGCPTIRKNCGRRSKEQTCFGVQAKRPPRANLFCIALFYPVVLTCAFLLFLDYSTGNKELDGDQAGNILKKNPKAPKCF
jgi:hypothetical protein